MAQNTVTRKVAAILAADAVGYTRLMADDETATIDALDEARAVFAEHVEANQGRVVDTAGDSVLSVFETTAGAVHAAVAIQASLAKINAPVPEERRMLFHIGVHLGDIQEKADGTVYGDGVNVAARLEGLAAAGGIVVSDVVQGALRSRSDMQFSDAGEHEVKNVAEPVRAYSIGGEAVQPKAKAKYNRAWALAAAAVLAIVVVGGGAWLMGPPEQPAPEVDLAVTIPTGPKIAVLPFANPSGDPNEEYFSDGLTEDIINRLTNFPNILVFARNSTNKYKGQDVDASTVGAELGASYVVEGSVRRLEDQLRVTAQLLDAADGTNLWAKTFDRDLTAANLFAVQDEITEGIVNAIGDYAGVISRSEAERAERKPPESLSSLECYYVQDAYYWSGPSAEKHLEIRDCFERALAEDADDVLAHTGLIWAYRDEHVFGFNPQPDSLDRALAAALRAVELDRNDATAYYGEALVRFNRGDLEGFRVAADRALDLAPHNASILADIGSHMVWIGESKRGAAMVEKAIVMNPDHQVSYHYSLAHYYRTNGDFETALSHALRLTWGWYWDHVHRATIYVEMGRLDEAHAEADKLMEANPEFGENVRAEFETWNVPDEMVNEYIDLLRQAGVEFPNEGPTTN
jgi:adenylate cyclase